MAFWQSPKTRRNLSRILPFGLIWLLNGWFFLLNDVLVTGNRNLDPDASVSLSLPVFLFASVAITLVGLVVGTVELVVLEKRFRYYSFTAKVAYKFLIYLGLMLLIMLITFPIATKIEQGVPFTSEKVWNKTWNFFQSVAFANTLLQLAFHLILSLLYAAVSENLGYQVLRNLITGRYHKPIKEERIFMFLDMKASTTIAEQLGHERYFSLLQRYYDVMSDAIIRSRGEVYQYIGDEVVVTWPATRGFENNHCLRCFEEIKVAMAKAAPRFEKRFGVVPKFKAGIHVGEVTTGEIGALKKEITYTGDVLNTAARIQGLCNTHQTDLIVSGTLLNGLQNPVPTGFRSIGTLPLKGKSELVELHAITV